ncbi:MAG: hypothetical protein HF978_01785 [Desulfobacteraceae bacterium]|nr:hypothetical protein [Desulfobacteraceae bacterium]MBC2754254.1 hypothetical protein [Desulfobacteraceae bacterium]
MRKQIGLVIRRAFILLTLCWLHFQTAYALDVNGVISEDSRWTTADSPINITGDVQLEINTTLTIDPGVKVIFQSSPDISQGYSIRIDGTLIARGDQMQPVIFTAADSSIPWGAIMFSDASRDWDKDTSTGSVIEYCVIEYGGNEPDGAGMISTFNAMPLIARNAIRFGVAAGISSFVSEDPAVISSLSGDLRIISNQIYNNATGIRFGAEGGIIEDNYFLNNNLAMDFQVRSNDAQVVDNTVFSSAPELFGTGIRLFFDEAASGIAAYQWLQTAGTPVTLSNPQSARTAFIASDPGSIVETLSFDLTVTNKNGLQTTETVEITITGDNPPPVANAGADGNVQLPQEEGVEVIVTLNGAGSYDPYLGIAGYAWEQTEGKTVALQGADTIAPTFIVPASVLAGDRMTFQLTVTDQGGLTSTDTIDIVYYDDNVFPVAAAGEDQTVSQGSAVILNGTGSSDPDGSISAYTWVQTDGSPVDLINPNTATPYFEAPTDNKSAEIFAFRLQVTDNGGLQATDDISITVNGPLIADIRASVFAGSLVILDGSTSIDQNATANIDIGSNVLEMDNEDAGLIALTVVENASFQLNVTGNNFNAIENEGYIVYTYNWSGEAPPAIAMPDNWWGTDDAIIIENLIFDQDNNYRLPVVEYQPFSGQDIPGVGSSLPYPPIADAGPDLETAADNSVTLDGSDSYDPDGIATYHWQQIDGPVVDLKNADQAIATFVAPLGGVDGAILQFQLTVSTDDTFSHSDGVNVTVSPDEDLPIVDVGGCFLQSATSNHMNDSFFGELIAMIFLCLIAVLGVSCRSRIAFPVVCILLAALVLIVTPAHAGYFAVGGGAGGDADEVNVTIETGAKDIHANKLDLLFGTGLFFIPHSDNELPASTISLPCPNDDCTRIGSVRKGTEVGFYGKFGVEIGSSDFYVSAIGGFTAFTESELSYSPATGRVYEDSSDSKVEALYGGGVSYFIDYKWNVVLQVDYDNIRGVTGTIGWHW